MAAHWAETRPVQGGREPLWELSRDRTGAALRHMTSSSEKTDSSQVLLISLKGISLFTREVDNIRNNYYSQLNGVTKNDQNKTYGTVNHLLKCTCLMYILNVHLLKCTCLDHNLVIKFYA